MSELKAFYLARYAGEFTMHEVYLKSEADKVIARNKYKRCLAMAKLCHWKMGVFIYKKEKNEFYYRWRKRWLAIAEKFKTNSIINGKEA
jgi:hypothetical protein